MLCGSSIFLIAKIGTDALFVFLVAGRFISSTMMSPDNVGTNILHIIVSDLFMPQWIGKCI